LKTEGLQLIHPFPEWGHKVRAAFSTRQGGFSSGNHSSLNLGFRCGDDPEAVERNWNAVRIETGLSGKTLVMPNMVHADILADADPLPETGARIEPQGADAVFSRSDRRILAVTMADCLTALIFDPGRNTIAAVHAGWRGTRLGILGKTLRFLASEKHITPEDTWVALGPCLRPESFEVGEEVADRLDPRFLIRGGGKVRFDMPACNREQALAAGIRPECLRDMGGDSLTEPARYFSYRRDGQASGRMAAIISLV
jgi:YfiH family protein